MSTKKGFYHKKCFSCIKCKAQVDYFNAIEGPDDEVCFVMNSDYFNTMLVKATVSTMAYLFYFIHFQVYCKICYKRYHGPGGHNKFGEKTTFPCDDESPEACIRCTGICKYPYIAYVNLEYFLYNCYGHILLK